jgi:hypothetical protein
MSLCPGEPFGVVIVMATRWNVDDFTGPASRSQGGFRGRKAEALPAPWIEYQLPALAKPASGRGPQADGSVGLKLRGNLYKEGDMSKLSRGISLAYKDLSICFSQEDNSETAKNQRLIGNLQPMIPRLNYSDFIRHYRADGTLANSINPFKGASACRSGARRHLHLVSCGR